MAIVQTLNRHAFINEFMQSSRSGQFSHDALSAIFKYLEEYSDNTGDPIELDIVGICCEWAEMSWAEIASSYDVDLSQCTDEDERMGEVEDFLCRNTQYVELPDGKSFVFVQF